VWFAQAIYGEVVDGNSGAPTKGKSGIPRSLPSSFLSIFVFDSLLTCFFICFTGFLRKPLRAQRPAMADGDDPTSHNYELRVMGLCGDDENHLAADAEEFFGSNAAINLDADV
jgi:hypothetical protein